MVTAKKMKLAAIGVLVAAFFVINDTETGVHKAAAEDMRRPQDVMAFSIVADQEMARARYRRLCINLSPMVPTKNQPPPVAIARVIVCCVESER